MKHQEIKVVRLITFMNNNSLILNNKRGIEF